jgi:hypothetical protein
MTYGNVNPAPQDTTVGAPGPNDANTGSPQLDPSLLNDGNQKPDPNQNPNQPQPKAPEQYAAFTMKDGMTWDEEFGGLINPLAKEFDLSQEQYDKLVGTLVDYADKKFLNPSREAAKQQQEERAAMRAKSEAFLKSDPSVPELVRRARDAFITKDELLELDRTEQGDSDILLRVLHRVGKAIVPDRVVDPTSAGGDQNLTPAQRIFGKK